MLATAALFLLLAAPAPKPIAIEVDAREAPRRLFKAKLTIPASPGPLSLTYPKWIPGEHGPSGPVVDLSALRFSAAGRELPWRRDPGDMFVFHLEVPKGADAVEASLEYLSPTGGGQFSSGVSATENLAVVSWNTLALQPRGQGSDALTYSPSLILPAGWKHGSSLSVAREAGGRVEFQPVSFTMLVDAPVIMGRFFRTIPLGEGPPTERIYIAADSEAALAAPQAVIDGWKALFAETRALFGARHYRSYAFLLTLSDHVASFGLEHHESSDNRVRERSLIDNDTRRQSLDLLPHELAHSWNGKYRRPAGLPPGSFERPVDSELLWIYEGLTNYLGWVLGARSGLIQPEEYREALALLAAEMEANGGRAWRPTRDTATAAQILYGARPDWTGRRRSVDFYLEGNLLWLDADTLIREKTGGQKGLDDFCRAFYGGGNGAPQVVPYTRADIVAALNGVVAHDWDGFFKERVESVAPKVNLAGIERAGYRVAWSDALPKLTYSREEVNEVLDARFALGFEIDKKSWHIPDVLPGTPADRAGVGPGMRLVAVNGRKPSREVLRDALAAAKAGDKSLELLFENAEFFRSLKLAGVEGDRHPHLEAVAGKPDLLSEITKPRAAAK